MTHWIKLYTEILNDPKMLRLDDHLWRRTIELFLLAGLQNRYGTLPNIDDIALHFRSKDVTQVLKDLQELKKIGIVKETKSGWVVTKFTARQAPSAAAIRMRRYRNKLRNVTHNENVTVLNQNQTQNQNQNQNQTQKREDDDGIVFEMFENNICLLNARMAEQLGDAIDTYGRDRVIEGIKIASDNNGRTVKYLLTVLENRKNGKDFRKKKPKDMNSQEARERYGEWEK